MNKLITICIFLCFLLPTFAQKFKVTRDTIVMNPSWLTPDSPRCKVIKVVEYHNDYYCLCTIEIPSDPHYSGFAYVEPFERDDYYYVLRINSKDKSRRIISYPHRLEYGRQQYPVELFVRRDSLICKWEESYQRDRYEMMDSDLTEEAYDLCLDPKTGSWTKTKLANDDVYEDRRWLITNADVISYASGYYSIYTDK
ncbi:MAG: hypothetical protein K5899_12320, partial [Bacteroidaceae bacterium]|nr:hypothetical protein [Bacteroidaceae bacterium]